MGDLEQEIKKTKVIIHSSRYAYLKAKKPSAGNHFLVTKDADEVTIVTEERHISKIQYEKSVKWFRLLEFKVTKPFLCVGFLAAITRAIASQGRTILIVSTFSKDYALVKEEDLGPALKALREIGFSIKREDLK